MHQGGFLLPLFRRLTLYNDISSFSDDCGASVQKGSKTQKEMEAAVAAAATFANGQTHPSACLPALNVAIRGGRRDCYLRESRRGGRTARPRGARQLGVALREVMRRERRTGVPRDL